MTTIHSSPSKLKKYVSLGLGTAITAVLLAWAFRGVDLRSVWQALQQAKWQWLFLGWLAYLASYWVRAWRWGTLLAATTPPGHFNNRLAAIFVGFGASSVLPSYVGEFLRAGVVFRKDQISMGAAVGSIFAERLLDVGMVFLFLLLPIWMGALPLHSSLSSLPLGWIGAAIVLLWATFVIGASFPKPIAQVVGSLCQFVGLGKFKASVTSALTSFLEGLTALKQPQRSSMAFLQTVMVWLLNGITYWSGLVAFGLTAPGFLGALFTQSATALAIAIPSTPGYVGPFEAGVRFSLGIYDIAPDSVLAYAIALRFLMYVTIPIIAAVIALRMSLFQGEFLAAFKAKLK